MSPSAGAKSDGSRPTGWNNPTSLSADRGRSRTQTQIERNGKIGYFIVIVIRELSYNGRMSPLSIRRVPAEGKPLTVRVDANLDRRLQAAALREGMSVSDFVRQAITEHLDRGAAESTLWDRIAPAVVRRGRRGAASNAPDRGTLGWLADS